MRGVERSLLEQELFFVHYVAGLLRMIGMKAPRPPTVDRYPTLDGNGGYGISVYQPIVESYVIIDIWPEIGAFSLDVHSCLEFDEKKIRINLVNTFQTDDIDLDYIQRSLVR